MRKLGSRQLDVLASLRRHGSWHRRCGWVWDTTSSTERIMKSLVRAGYATVDKGTYRPFIKEICKNVVVLSGGHTVDGDNPRQMLKLQHRILLLLSKNLAAKYGEDSVVQKAICDANMLGLEVADRLTEDE